MTNRNSIAQIWAVLEDERSLGLVKRLYSQELEFLIFATFQYPESYYGIAFSFHKEIRLNISSFSNLKELKIVLLDDTTFPDSNLLVVQLLNPDNRDIFASLCENLIQAISREDTEQKVARTVINQLEKWKTLFDTGNNSGLDTSAQQGLFGELHFLYNALLQFPDSPQYLLETWVGADRALRDFQGDKWAVEIKTTSANNPQRIIINGERQLDETFIENLFLLHLSVEVSNRNGITLIQKITDIRNLLLSNKPVLNMFNAKLFEAGYLDKQESFYQTRHYHIRNENYYMIGDDFPRIKENELRSGVGEVRYSIVISMCDEYMVSRAQVFNAIKEV